MRWEEPYISMNGGRTLHVDLSLVTKEWRAALDPLKVYNLPTIEALLIFPFLQIFFFALSD